MTTARTIVGLCLLLAPFAGSVVLSLASVGVKGTLVVFGAVAVIVGCIVGGLALLDG